jgi:hypothetical protein
MLLPARPLLEPSPVCLSVSGALIGAFNLVAVRSGLLILPGLSPSCGSVNFPPPNGADRRATTHADAARRRTV